jgi:hypothetical protein
MISYESFGTLRLADFYAPVEDIEELEDWEFMDCIWVGEAVGFTEWLRLATDPGTLRSMSLSLAELPEKVVSDVHARIGLRLRTGMTFEEVTAILGEPTATQQFVADRRSYAFVHGDDCKYDVSCTVHQDDGLIYVVIMAQDYRA